MAIARARPTAWLPMAGRGVVAVIFGIAVLIWPGPALSVLIALFGIYAIIDGIGAVFAGVRTASRHRNGWLVLAEGILGIVAGVVAFVYPGITALALLFVIAAWAVLTGVLEIAAGAQLRHWWFVVAGVVSILFGLYLFVFPGAGALSVLFLIGAYAIIFGILVLVHALQLRSQEA